LQLVNSAAPGRLLGRLGGGAVRFGLVPALRRVGCPLGDTQGPMLAMSATRRRTTRRRGVGLPTSDSDMKVLPDSVPAFIWYKDRENRILRANRLAAESRGMSIEEVEGRSVYDLYPEEAEKYHRDDLEVIRSGTPKLGIVEVLRTASGEKRWV